MKWKVLEKRKVLETSLPFPHALLLTGRAVNHSHSFPQGGSIVFPSWEKLLEAVLQEDSASQSISILAPHHPDTCLEAGEEVGRKLGEGAATSPIQ